MDLNEIKRLLKASSGEKFVFVENGEPSFVAMEYQQSLGKASPVTADRTKEKPKIYPNVILGSNVTIEDHCIVGKPPKGKAEGELPTVIGDNAVIRSHTVIYAGNRIGNHFQTGHHVLMREENQIGDNVSIGSFSNIEHHIVIADKVRIHSKVFIPEYTRIEQDAWIGPGVIMTNASFPGSARAKETLVGPTVERKAVVGAAAVLLPGVRVGEGAVVGAGAVVTRDVDAGMVVVGNPAHTVKSASELTYRDTGEPAYSAEAMPEPEKKTVPLVDLKAQYRAIKPEIDGAIARVIASTQFIGGEEVKNFEEQFAAFCNKRFCVGVSNGTTAIELTLKALGIGPGDEVITTPMTFIATSEAIVNVGATPRFVDIDERTFNIDITRLEAAITPNTRAIIPVHLYGQPADLDTIYEIAQRHNLLIVEDCAQAHGATLHGYRMPMGIGTFSFFPGKNLGAYGDAGAVVTDDEELARRLSAIRDHGRSTKYEHELQGTNARLDPLQAAILGAKLPHLGDWVADRQRIAARYTELLAGLPVVTPFVDARVTHAFHLYVIRTANRDALATHLKNAGIASGIHYPIPLHLQPVYRNLGYRAGDFPITERIAGEILSLPIYPELTDSDIEKIVSSIRQFFSM